jgi:hypothetical protein
MKIPQAILDAKQKAEAELLSRPGVTGVDVGFKRVKGKRTDVIAIRVKVARKGATDPAQAIPTTIDGIPTDVIETRWKLHIDTTRYNPLKGGASIGPERIISGRAYAGTLGCIVTDNSTGAKMVLSNWHVLCVDTDFSDGTDGVLQPSWLEGGNPTDRCATLARQSLGGSVDCAVALLDSGQDGAGEIEDIGAITGVTTAELGDHVRKRGRTSGLTYGIVDGLAGSVTTDYGGTTGSVTLTGQISIEPDTDHNSSFGDHGDSGSVVVNADGDVVGLYYAGSSDGSGAANPIAAVLSALAVSVFTGSGGSTGTTTSTLAQYLSRPLLLIRPDFANVTAGQMDDFSYVTQGMGRSTPWKVTSGPKRTVATEFLFGTHPEQKEFRKFFSDLAGRRRGFWLPCQLDEYRVTADAAKDATVITVERTGLHDADSSFASYQHLCLVTKDKIECYKIDHVTISGTTEQITLTSGIATDLVADQTVCGGLLFCRLNDDKLTFKHRNDIVSRLSVTFVELPTEYDTEHTGSAPVYLYEITRGIQVWRYANFGADLNIGGQLWSSSDITHGALMASVDLISQELEVRVGTDDPTHPFRFFNSRLNSALMTVRIFKTDYLIQTVDLSQPIFAGRVESVPFRAKGVISAQLSTAFRVGETQFPKVQMIRMCNNRLFDGICLLAAADWTTTGAITALDTTVTLPWVEAAEFGAMATTKSDPDWFALGLVTVGTEVRICTGQDGNRLYLNAPFSSAIVTNLCSAAAGCDKRVSTCNLKFANLAHYLGWPYIPNENPTITPLIQPTVSTGKKG